MKKVLIHIVELVKVRLPRSIMLGKARLSFCREGNTRSNHKPSLALENGFHFLLEGGGRILLEKEGTKVFPPAPKQPIRAVSLENGGQMLLESGGKLKLENNN